MENRVLETRCLENQVFFSKDLRRDAREKFPRCFAERNNRLQSVHSAAPRRNIFPKSLSISSVRREEEIISSGNRRTVPPSARNASAPAEFEGNRLAIQVFRNLKLKRVTEREREREEIGRGESRRVEKSMLSCSNISVIFEFREVSISCERRESARVRRRERGKERERDERKERKIKGREGAKERET